MASPHWMGMLRHPIAQFDNARIVISKDEHPRLPSCGLLFCHLGETHDHEQISRLTQMRCCAIERERPRTRGCLNRVRFETLPIGNITNKDFFVRQEPYLSQKFTIDGKTPLIITVSFRDFGAQDLRTQNRKMHNR